MSSYRQIFKSTALVGGSQLVLIVLGLVRGKALAVWLGKVGVGDVGLLSTGISLIGVVTGLGIGASGVRQIAESSSSGDQEKFARTVRTLRVSALLTSIIGVLIAVAFCRQLSHITFGSYDHSLSFALVGVMLLFSGISSGQVALLQGLRRLKEMASAQIVGALLGSTTGILLVYLLRDKGGPWFLLSVAASAAVASWWFARRVEVPKPHMTVQDFRAEARGLLSMGVAFMTANLVTTGTAYVTRVLIQHNLPEGSVGLYQATWNLSSQYVGVILAAMAVDFAPRLTSVAKDDAQVNRLVNEQMELGVLLALPGVLATMAFAPWVLHIFNSREFVDAADLVRWHMLGVFLRVVSWPLGMIVIAKGLSRVFIYVEVGMGVLNIAMLTGCMKLWKLEGVGIAFSLLYVSSFILNWVLCRRLSGYASSSRGRKIIGAATVIVVVGFLLTRVTDPTLALGAGSALLLVTCIGCYVGLRKLLQIDPWAVVMKKLGIRKAA